MKKRIAVLVTVTSLFALALIHCFGAGLTDEQLDGVFFGLGGNIDSGIVGGTDGRLGSTTDGGVVFAQIQLQFDISQPEGVSQSAKNIPQPSFRTINWDISDVQFKDAFTGIVIGDEGGVLRTTDAGQTWNEIDLGINTKLWGAKWDLSLSAAYTYGEEGTVFRSDDDGLSWNLQTTPNLKIIYGGCFRDAQAGWLVGEDGLVLETGDGGTNWQEKTLQNAGAPIDLTGFRLRDCYWGLGGYGFIVGEGAKYLRTENDGANWTSMDVDSNTEFRKIDFKADGSLGFMVGDPSYLGRTLDMGLTWYEIPLSPGAELALAIKDAMIQGDRAWGIGHGDFLYRCDNVLNDPADPEPPLCVQIKVNF